MEEPGRTGAPLEGPGGGPESRGHAQYRQVMGESDVGAVVEGVCTGGS